MKKMNHLFNLLTLPVLSVLYTKETETDSVRLVNIVNVRLKLTKGDAKEQDKFHYFNGCLVLTILLHMFMLLFGIVCLHLEERFLHVFINTKKDHFLNNF